MTTDDTGTHPTHDGEGAGDSDGAASAPEPTDTDHPAGEDHASDNTDNEPPA